MIVTFDDLKKVIFEKLLMLGSDEKTAEICAQTIAENDLDGVSSHGTGRFLRLATMIRDGNIKLNVVAECEQAFGAFEVWDGKLGMGITNAKMCMDRATDLASRYGIGCVALRNTNHWLRGGTYGIQATMKGFVGVCWTTTSPNMPPWGSDERTIGNNPLIFAVPYNGSYVLMDSAMAQFSYGAIENAIRRKKNLPLPGGYDSEGNLTTDPVEISKTWRVLPIGFWKGSGFSILLDMIASGLSKGKTVSEIGRQGGQPVDEYNLCQMFIAIKPFDMKEFNMRVESIIESVKKSRPVSDKTEIRIPSENSKKIHDLGMRNGINVDDSVWQSILDLK